MDRALLCEWRDRLRKQIEIRSPHTTGYSLCALYIALISPSVRSHHVQLSRDIPGHCLPQIGRVHYAAPQEVIDDTLGEGNQVGHIYFFGRNSGLQSVSRASGQASVGLRAGIQVNLLLYPVYTIDVGQGVRLQGYVFKIRRTVFRKALTEWIRYCNVAKKNLYGRYRIA